MERRLTTIVAADLAGYSRLVAADEEGTLARLAAALADLIDPELNAAGARIVKTMGDGLLAEFPSPVAALRACIAIQQAMVEREAGETDDRRLRFRVGINLGDVVVEHGDLFGDAVNIAARLESLAPPGGICVSRAVHDQLRGKVAAPMTALGAQAVKNIPDPVEVWRVEIEGVAPPRPAPRPAEPPSVAVLPFDNLSSDPEQSFLADGIVADVITELSRFRSLFVIARNSTFAYRGSPKGVREIARDLGATYVVEGSVRRAGPRLRVSAQLIDATSGTHLWADRWDRTLEDIFDIQDELTGAIVSAVEPELGAHERTIARRRPTDSLTAWELYQRAHAEYVSPDEDDSYLAAFDYLTRAVEADPDFALPHQLFARWYFYHVVIGRAGTFRNDYLREGLNHAETAIRLDSHLDLGFIGKGLLLSASGRFREAREALDRAEALNPNNHMLWFARGVWQQYQEEPDADEWERACRMGLKLSPKDPLQWMHHYYLGWAGLLRHRDFAHPDVRAAMETAAGFPEASFHVHFCAALSCLECGDTDEARRHVARGLEVNPDISLASWFQYDGPAWPRVFTGPEVRARLVPLGLPDR